MAMIEGLAIVTSANGVHGENKGEELAGLPGREGYAPKEKRASTRFVQDEAGMGRQGAVQR
jgi:hypothetical protein